MDPVSTMVGVAGSLLGSLPSGKSLGDIASAATGAVGNLSPTTPFVPAGGDGISDDQYIDLLAVVGAASAQTQLLSLWKANRNKVYMTPAWLAFFADRRLVSNPTSPTKADKQFVTLFALVVSGSPLPARKVEETWLGNRDVESLRSADNQSVLAEWGVTG